LHPRQSIKIALSLLRHPVYTVCALTNRGDANDAGGMERCVRRGADWLLRAQAMAPDGDGYSRRYSLLTGWDRCYIETTGYIIPTLLNVSQALGEPKYRESAFRAAEWLLKVQTTEGAFTDIDNYRPQVFDTGQVLLGLNRMFRETGDERYLASAKRASRWLVDNQEPDGSWVRFAYRGRPHSYYSRVAAALIESGQLSGIEEYVISGTKNLEWVAAQRQSNGYFRHSEFNAGEDAFLHTIAYILEGFSMAFQSTGERRWADLLIDGVQVLTGLSSEDGLLYSQYDREWRSRNTEYCTTGLAQYAGICFDVGAILGAGVFYDRATQVVRKLCYWQQRGGVDISGAVQSSVPLWGRYGSMEFYNWNVKFSLDAAVKCVNVDSYHDTRVDRS